MILDVEAMVDNLHECYSTANSDVIVVSPIIIVLTPRAIVFMDIGPRNRQKYDMDN